MTDFVHVTGSERTSGEHPPGPEPAVIPMVNPALLSAYQARLLDPATATRKPGRTQLNPTVYVGNTLLVRGLPTRGAADTIKALQGVADGLGLTVGISARDLRYADAFADDPYAAVLDSVWATRLTLSSTSDTASAPPDAWAFLESARAHRVVGDGAAALEHVWSACGGTWRSVGGTWGSVGGTWGSVGGTWGSVGGTWGSVGGTWGSVGGTWGSVGGPISEYGAPGFGGRTPVSWAGTDPYRHDPDGPRAPTVVVLDTGLGDHPWFRNERGYRSTLAVSRPPGADPEAIGVVTDPLNGMVDPDAGHGTFIAGMIRQRCPGAHIAAVAVTPASGAALEQDILIALALLLRGQHQAIDNGDAASLTDVVNFSMGYYHETPTDAATDGPLRSAIDALTAAGVIVVAAAGNDATSTPFFPAAFAGAGSPLVSVGALNPDGASVALFSNNGTQSAAPSWITTHAIGAGVVSTVPVTLSGGRGRSVFVDRNDPAPRATVDPDDYRSGFAVWSGTSFAAPRIAGDLLAALATDADLGVTTLDAATARAERAVATVLDAAAKSLGTAT